VVFAAALQIQRVIRRFLMRRPGSAKAFPQMLQDWKDEMATCIQTKIRQFLAKCRASKMTHRKNLTMETTEAKVGAIIKAWRNHRMRCLLRQCGVRRRIRRREQDCRWGATEIQRYEHYYYLNSPTISAATTDTSLAEHTHACLLAKEFDKSSPRCYDILRVFRGYLARRILALNRRLELSLDHELLKLAEDFLVDDDMTGLLEKLSEKVQQARRDSEHVHQVEEQQAEIFRDQVSNT